MKKLSVYWILAGAALVGWWLLRGKAQTKEVSPVEIDALASNVSQGLSAGEEVGLFDRLFGIRDASRELAKLKAGIGGSNRIKICHSDGTCEVVSRAVIGQETANPLKAPKYFLDYLGVTF